MDDLHTNRCRHDEEFNLFCAAEALKGITHAIYEMLADIPTAEPEADEWQRNITGLVSAGKEIARDIHAFIYEATDRTRMPVRYKELKQKKGPSR